MNSKFITAHRILAAAVAAVLILWLPIATHSHPQLLQNYDFVVIDWISEGSIIAKRLSEDPNWNILVLAPGILNHGKEFLLVEQTNNSWAHLLRWPRLPSERNTEPYIRGVPQDYDLWVEKGNQGWGWNDLLPYFRRTEGKIGVHENYVVIKEPNSFCLNSHYKRFKDIFFINNLNQSASHDFTASTSSGYFPNVEVREFVNRSNYDVVNKAEPVHINFDVSGERVESIELVIDDEEVTINISKELILAAGAIESAKLLMLSGIGPKNHLNRLGIPVIRDLPVGRNLRDPVTLPLFLTISDIGSEDQEETLNCTETESFKAQGMLPLTEFINTVSGDNTTTPDIEYKYFYIGRQDWESLKKKWQGIENLYTPFYYHLMHLLHTKNLLIVQVTLLHPKSVGSVELRTDDFMYSPKISANYLGNKEDVATLLKSISTIKKKFQNLSLWGIELQRPLYPYPMPSILNNYEELYWAWYIQSMLMPKLMPAGTVMMGSNRNESCVNSRLLVHGVKNLRVADAGIMPELPSGELTAAAMMIAEKAADFVKEDWMVKI